LIKSLSIDVDNRRYAIDYPDTPEGHALAAQWSALLLAHIAKEVNGFSIRTW